MITPHAMDADSGAGADAHIGAFIKSLAFSIPPDITPEAVRVLRDLFNEWINTPALAEVEGREVRFHQIGTR